MRHASERPFFRLALIGALVAALGLAACGRKGPLDPPPVGSSLAADKAGPIGSESTAAHPGVGPEGQPLAPAGPNRRIPLDVLLN